MITDCVFIGTSAAPGILNEGLLVTRKNNTVVTTSGLDPVDWDAY